MILIVLTASYTCILYVHKPIYDIMPAWEVAKILIFESLMWHDISQVYSLDTVQETREDELTLFYSRLLNRDHEAQNILTLFVKAINNSHN